MRTKAKGGAAAERERVAARLAEVAAAAVALAAFPVGSVSVVLIPVAPDRPPVVVTANPQGGPAPRKPSRSRPTG